MRYPIDNSQGTVMAQRAARLLDRIKIETRWLLASAPVRRADRPTYEEARAKLIASWPAIRHRRVERHLLASFYYDVAADGAALLAHLIEVRRARRVDRTRGPKTQGRGGCAQCH
jgi:hypothetical protein